MRKSKKRLLLKEQPFIFNYNKTTALKAAISISFILAFVMLLSSMFFISLGGNRNIVFIDIFSWQSVVSLLFNTLLLYFLFWVQFQVITKFPHKRMRAVILLIISFMVVVFISPIFTRLQWRWFYGGDPDKLFMVFQYAKNLIILVLSFLYISLIYLINENQKNIVENQKLVIENLQNRYNALKNQIDPHFLFNSLNTLNGLIGFDDGRAHEYVGQLSHVFRYSMQDQDVIELEDELKFAESYIYLMKIRYNDALNVHMKIDPRCRKFLIMPFGLQILVENAIKHNVITRKRPLCIIIETTPEGTVVVENNIQLKYSTAESNGLGLTNLNERYRLMFNKEIDIKPNQTKFIVEIPLIGKSDHLKIKPQE